MPTNKAFIATTDPGAQLPAALTLPVLQSRIAATKPVAWYWKANLSVGYDPFLVYVWSLDAATKTLTFSFVNCETGQLPTPTQKFSVQHEDLDFAHGGSPSTDRTTLKLGDADIDKNVCVVFLMLNPAQFDASMTKAATDAGQTPSAAKGKWPGTAKAPDAQRAAGQRLIANLISALERAGAPADQVDDFRREAAEL